MKFIYENYKEIEDEVKEALENLYEADEPPADEPPADKPPSDEPQADEPPAEEPPANEPQADEPPAEEPSADEPSKSGNSTDDTSNGASEDNDSSNDEDDEDDEDDENVEYGNIDDFITQTESEVTVSNEGAMPSQIYGNRDMTNHYKHRVTIKNDKGQLSFIVWTSTPTLTDEAALKEFKKTVDSFKNSMSFNDFKIYYKYDEVETEVVQKSLNGWQKLRDEARKMYTEQQIKAVQDLKN